MAFDTDTERDLQHRFERLRDAALYDRIMALPIRMRGLTGEDCARFRAEAARRQGKKIERFCREFPDLCKDEPSHQP